MGLFRVVGKQLQHPKGMLGRALFGWMTASTLAHARWTAELMDVQTGDDILEVGFGNGANLALLAEAAFRNAGFTGTRTERNDAVRFGAYCMLGRKPTSA